MSDLMFRNPRLAILMVCLILVAGLSSYTSLPRMEDPILAERVAMINTRLPGATAERVEALVTEPIEQEFREIDEIKVVTSISRSGISTLMVELGDEITEVDEVWSRVRDKLADVAPELPTEATPPNFRQMHMKAFAMIVAISWDKPDAPTNYAILRRHAEALEDRFLALPGTEKVRTFGDPDEEYVATVEPNKLAALGLDISTIARDLAATDSKVSAGQIRGTNTNLPMEVEGELTSLERIGRTPIKLTENGQALRLEDIAKIEKGITQPPSSVAIVRGQKSVTLGVLVQDNRRVDAWSRLADDLIAKYQTELPRGLRLQIVFRQNDYVESRLLGLLGNLLFGALGVMAVILVLMGWRSAVIVGTALPLSALMVLTGMNMLGIPIHQMSITGLIIALGLLIDNAIVMVDETKEELDAGIHPARAVSKTVRHLGIPLLGSTITTALAFAPIALMPGPAGEFVGSIAISVMLAIFSSLFLAMTLIPALTAWVAKGPAGKKRWTSNGINGDFFRSRYEKLVELVLKRPWVGVASGVVLPIIGFAVASQLPEQFFPPADRDQFQIEVELPSQSSLQNTLAVTDSIREQVLKEPHVTSVDWFLGESAPTFYYNVISRRESTASYAQALVQLDQLEGTRETIHRLQDKLDRAFPETRVLVRQLEQGPPFDAPVEIRVFGPDLDKLREYGHNVRQRLAKLQNVIHTRSDLAETLPKVALSVDEESARLVGLNRTSIASQLQSALEGQIGGTVLESTEELPVRVRLGDADRASLERIESISLVSPTARENQTGSANVNIPVSALASVSLQPETSVIMHRYGQRMNEVQAYIKAGILPATVIADFKQSLKDDPLEMQPGYNIRFGGEAAERDAAVGNLLSKVSVLFVLMLATLVLSFSSFRIAGVVLSVAALSLGLGMGALWMFGFPFGFMAIIGSMGLMGVAINDAIVVLAGIKADPDASVGDVDAIGKVVLQKTRHIIATTLTTIAGFAPLVIAGGEFWPPMAVAISGGVAGATILALLFVPSLYVIAMCKRESVAEATESNAATQVQAPPEQLVAAAS